MSLHVDPKITVSQIKKGEISGTQAIKAKNDLIAEVTSGIYTLKQMGLKNMRELRGLKSDSTH